MDVAPEMDVGPVTDVAPAIDVAPASVTAPPLPSPRSSILFKVVGALVVALAASTVVTALVASRLTSSALDRQARLVATSHLSVLQEAYSERERSLLVNTRSLAESLTSRGLLDPKKRPELVAELGRSAGSLEFGILRVLDAG